jgi:hypothetical protein
MVLAAGFLAYGVALAADARADTVTYEIYTTIPGPFDAKEELVAGTVFTYIATYDRNAAPIVDSTYAPLSVFLRIQGSAGLDGQYAAESGGNLTISEADAFVDRLTFQTTYFLVPAPGGTVRISVDYPLAFDDESQVTGSAPFALPTSIRGNMVAQGPWEGAYSPLFGPPPIPGAFFTTAPRAAVTPEPASILLLGGAAAFSLARRNSARRRRLRAFEKRV